MLIGKALFRLHAQVEEDHGQHKFTDVEQFLPRKWPSIWPAWHLAALEPFGFGLNNRHTAARQCAFILAWLYETKSWHVL